jgi:hypothetical protein
MYSPKLPVNKRKIPVGLAVHVAAGVAVVVAKLFCAVAVFEAQFELALETIVLPFF